MDMQYTYVVHELEKEEQTENIAEQAFRVTLQPKLCFTLFPIRFFECPVQQGNIYIYMQCMQFCNK